MSFTNFSRVLSRGVFSLQKRHNSVSSGCYTATGPFNFVNGKRCAAVNECPTIEIEEPATGNFDVNK